MTVYREVIKVQSHGVRTRAAGADAVLLIAAVLDDAVFFAAVPEDAVFFEEFCHDFDEHGDEYLQVDLNNALAKIIPDHTSAETYNYPGQAHYDAVASWPDAANYLPNGPEDLWNGDAHLRSTILGSSEVFDVVDGHLGVGTTGYIYFADFDRTRPRERRCVITVIGE